MSGALRPAAAFLVLGLSAGIAVVPAAARPDLVPLGPTTAVTPSDVDRIGSPALSSGGNRIAYLHGYDPLGTNPAGRIQLFIDRIDGQGLVQATRDDSLRLPENPVFGLDGVTVFFTAETGDPARRELYRVRIDGSELVRLTHQDSGTGLDAVGRPAPGPFGGVFFALGADLLGEDLDLSAGRRILYHADPGGTITRVSDPDTHPLRDAEVLGVSADGSSLAWMARDPDLGGQRSFRAFQLDVAGGIVTPVGPETGSGPITGSYSSVGERLVFSADADYLGTNGARDYQVFRADIDGNILEQLTEATFTGATRPACDGNGNAVTFESAAPLLINEPTGTSRVYLLEPGQVLRRRSTGWQPAMAADASRIAYVDDRDSLGTNGDGSAEVWSVRLSGLDRRQHTRYVPGRSESPDVSTDGAWVAFLSTGNHDGGNSDGSAEVWLAHPDGTGRRRLTTTTAPKGCIDPSLSRDGEWVVFGSDADLVPGENPDGNFEVFRVRNDGSELLQVTDTDQGTNRLPRISADGKRIVCVSTGDILSGAPMGEGRVAYWREQTGSFQILTPTADRGIDALYFSDDGTRVALLSSAAMDGRNPTHALRIFAITTDGSLLRMITVPGGLQAGGLAMSPEGNWLGAADGSGQLLLLPYNGGVADTVVDLAGVFAARPALGTDAAVIGFVSATAAGGFQAGDYQRLVRATGEVTALVDDTQPSPPSAPALSGDGNRVAFVMTGPDSLNPDGNREVFAATFATVAVRDLSVATARAADGHVEIRWRARTDDLHAYFLVGRAPAPAGPWTELPGRWGGAGPAYSAADHAAGPGDLWYRVTAVDRHGRTEHSDPVAVASSPPVTAGRPSLSVRPNPFRGEAVVEVRRATAGRNRVRVLTVAGRLVTTLADEPAPAGITEYRWNGRDAANRPLVPGVYFLVPEGGKAVRVVRLP